jgi:hypothetical protein
MSDEFSSDTSSPASSPSESGSMGHPVDVSNDPVINANRHAALEQLAKPEDISGYAQERQDQTEAIDKGRDLPEERQRQWFRRASKAVHDATLEAQGIQPNGQQPQPQQVSQDQYQYQDRTQDPNYMRKMGAGAERVNQYFGQDQERREGVVAWGQAMDPGNTVAEWIIENESVAGPAILDRLAQNPEAWQQLAALPPNKRDRWLGALEGHIVTERNYKNQLAQQQQQLQSVRQQTHAPPPIKALRGGAALPRDAHDLARSEDVSSYVALRRQQERKARE